MTMQMTPATDEISFADPAGGAPLREDGDWLVDASTGERRVPVRGGIPRFVSSDENYAESFGWQWNHWRSIRSESRSGGFQLRETILRRTHFGDYAMEGKTILECGMGGGDDTEVLLSLPFARVHAFDLSSAVERAGATLASPRLTISQASIFDIPYAAGSFDFVYCHRVLQHTPDPERALRACCRQVKPGGILFAHSYRRSFRQMSEWRYKYRWLTRRLPRRWVFRYVERCGPALFALTNWLRKGRFGRWLAHNFVPFHPLTTGGAAAALPPEQQLEWAKCVTFDALTPRHDAPMAADKFRAILESEGFRIDHFEENPRAPLCATAVRQAIADRQTEGTRRAA